MVKTNQRLPAQKTCGLYKNCSQPIVVVYIEAGASRDFRTDRADFLLTRRRERPTCLRLFLLARMIGASNTCVLRKTMTTRRGWAISGILITTAILLFAHAANPQNAPKIESFQARLTPVPIDVAMQSTVAGVGSATAVLTGKTSHHLRNIRRTAFPRDDRTDSPRAKRSSRSRDL